MQYGVFLNKTTKYKKELNTCVYIYIYMDRTGIYIYMFKLSMSTLFYYDYYD